MTGKSTPHRYSDLQAFERLMLLISTFVQYPGIGSLDDSETIGARSGTHHDALEEVIIGLQNVARDCGIDLPDYSLHTLRKDLQTLRRYKILDRPMYRWGYYLGSGVMNKAELRAALNALSSQASYQHDPQIRQVYDTILRRVQGLNIVNESTYPVRAQIDRSIVYTDPAEMMAHSKYRETLFEKLEQLETSIIQGQAIEIYRSRNPYETSAIHYLSVWPLQLIYADIAWYLLHEDCQSKHLAISRIDRFSDRLKLLDAKGRGSVAQRQSLLVAHQLLEAGWGLYLGQIEEQQLERSNQLEFVNVTVRFFPEVMAFIQEGEKRHITQNIQASRQQENGKPTYLDYSVILPPRSLNEFSRWVYRFMGNAQFMTPLELAQKHQQDAEKLLLRYRTSISPML